MNKSSLSAQLLSWAREFSEVLSEPLAANEKLWPFLAQRLLDSGLDGVEEDGDVIKFRVGDSYQSLRIVSWDRGRGILNCEFQGVTRSQYMMPIASAVRKVHSDDREKLAMLIDHLESP